MVGYARGMTRQYANVSAPGVQSACALSEETTELFCSHSALEERLQTMFNGILSKTGRPVLVMGALQDGLLIRMVRCSRGGE